MLLCYSSLSDMITMVSEMSICIIKTVGQLDMVTVISDRQLFTKNSGIGHESLYDIYT